MIGIFDSGFGGLTVYQAIKQKLPDYSYLYLGDNLRAPYGGRSQEAIYNFTIQALDYLFKQGCQLIILACNSASAEALRKIQQDWLPKNYPDRRVLGVIRPAVEAVADSGDQRIGIVGTQATIDSKSYIKELRIMNKELRIFQNACPLLVPMIEEGHLKHRMTKAVIKKCLRPLKDQQIKTLILGCTHYPLVANLFQAVAGKNIKILNGPKIVAEKLADYLNRHPEIEKKITKKATSQFLTTDQTEKFNNFASKLLGSKISAKLIDLP